MPQAVALHHRETPLFHQRLQPQARVSRGRHKRHAAASPLRLTKDVSLKPKQLFTLGIRELVEGPQRLS
jgi:hypothetical protein